MIPYFAPEAHIPIISCAPKLAAMKARLVIHTGTEDDETCVVDRSERQELWSVPGGIVSYRLKMSDAAGVPGRHSQNSRHTIRGQMAEPDSFNKA
jgi:hypothetical protein